MKELFHNVFQLINHATMRAELCLPLSDSFGVKDLTENKNADSKIIICDIHKYSYLYRPQ